MYQGSSQEMRYFGSWILYRLEGTGGALDRPQIAKENFQISDAEGMILNENASLRQIDIGREQRLTGLFLC